MPKGTGTLYGWLFGGCLVGAAVVMAAYRAAPASATVTIGLYYGHVLALFLFGFLPSGLWLLARRKRTPALLGPGLLAFTLTAAMAGFSVVGEVTAELPQTDYFADRSLPVYRQEFSPPGCRHQVTFLGSPKYGQVDLAGLTISEPREISGSATVSAACLVAPQVAFLSETSLVNFGEAWAKERGVSNFRTSAEQRADGLYLRGIAEGTTSEGLPATAEIILVHSGDSLFMILVGGATETYPQPFVTNFLESLQPRT